MKKVKIILSEEIKLKVIELANEYFNRFVNTRINLLSPCQNSKLMDYIYKDNEFTRLESVTIMNLYTNIINELIFNREN